MRKVFMAWYCGRAVQGLGETARLAVGYFPTSRSQNVRLRISTPFCAQYIPSLSASLSTARGRISSLLSAGLSPSSTGPINTTTRYINKLGVIA